MREERKTKNPDWDRARVVIAHTGSGRILRIKAIKIARLMKAADIAGVPTLEDMRQWALTNLNSEQILELE